MITTSIIAMNGIDAHRALVIFNRTQNAFVTGMLTASIHTLKAELSRRVVRLTFMKKDGTITTRYGTTMYADRHINGRGVDSDSRNVVSFLDCDAVGENKWRSFRFEKLISYE